MKKHIRLAVAAIREMAAGHGASAIHVNRGKRHPDKVVITNDRGNRAVVPIATSPRADDHITIENAVKQARQHIEGWAQNAI